MLPTQWNRVYDRDRNAIGVFVAKRQVNLLPRVNTWKDYSESDKMYINAPPINCVYTPC